MAMLELRSHDQRAGNVLARVALSGLPTMRVLLLAPAILLVFGFVIGPTVIALVESFRSAQSWTVANYITVLTEPPYPGIFWNTVVIALWTTLASMAISLPAAAFLAAQSSRWAGIIMGLIASTLWISILVKSYAWQVLLGMRGPVNDLLLSLHLTERPVPLLYTRGAVLISMVQFMIPYACILLVSGMRKVDWELITAARVLGARTSTVFRTVYWPQVRFTVVMTALIVFVIASSFFVAPALLGGPGETMLGMKMKSDLSARYDSGLAATTGTLLTLALLIISWIALKLTGSSFRRATEEVSR